MAKYNIKITKETGAVYEKEKIVEIDINNGHWKYWDNFAETEEKTSLTMNNFYDATYLKYPVKDAVIHYNQKELEENRKLVQDDAYVRTYDTLMGYLNCRIHNFKDMRSKEMTLYIVLFEQKFVRSNEDDITGNIVYEQEGLLKVEFKKVE